MSDHIEDEQRNHAFEDGGYPDNTRCTHPLTRYRCMRERKHHALFEQLAALRASVRTLGHSLGACMADPHTETCRSLWLCEQHRTLLAPPPLVVGAGDGE